MEAEGLIGLTLNGLPLRADREELRFPEQTLEIAAELPPRFGPRLSAYEVECGRERCLRVRAASGRVPLAPEELLLLVDASPSTVGPASGRLGPAAAALLASLPQGSRVRVLAFAARAEAIVARPLPPSEVPLDRIRAAREQGLGSATRFEAAWPTLRAWLQERSGARSEGRELPKRVVWLGDGGLTEGPELSAALAEARAESARGGVEWSLITLAGRSLRPGLARAAEALDARWVEVGEEADRWAAGRGREPLFARLYSALAPPLLPSAHLRLRGRQVELGPLRAGEEILWEGRSPDRAELRAGAPSSLGRARSAPPPLLLAEALRRRLRLGVGPEGGHASLVALDARDLEAARGEAASCRTQGIFHAASAVVARARPLALAASRRCDRSAIPSPPPPITSSAARTPRPGLLPARTLRRMLRRRGIPVARGCFRDDRAGRPSYHRRAVYVFTLADREVVSATVQGSISESLRACLARAMDALEVPPFEGSVEVRYPIYTAPVLPPPVLALSDDTAEVIDTLVEEEEGEPSLEIPASIPDREP